MATNKTTETGADIPAEKLTDGRSYRFMVTAYDGNNEAIHRRYADFIVDKDTESLFKLSKPVNGSTVKFDDIATSWTTCSGKSYYMYSLQDITTPKSPSWIIETTQTTKRSYTIPSEKIIAGHSYRFMVTAYDSDGDAIHRCISEFAVEGTKEEEAEKTFSITSPSEGSKLELEDLNASWTACEGVEYYKYALKDVTDSANAFWAIEDTKVNKSTNSIDIFSSDLVSGRSYKLVITAYDSANKVIHKSEVNFTIAASEENVGQDKYTAYNGHSYIALTGEANTIPEEVVTKAEALKILKSNINTLLNSDTFTFSSQQIECLLDIPNKIDASDITLNDMKSNLEFRFEGVGAYYGDAQTEADKTNETVNAGKLPDGYDMKGLFGAMTVVIQNGEVKNTDSIPFLHKHTN